MAALTAEKTLPSSTRRSAERAFLSMIALAAIPENRFEH